MLVYFECRLIGPFVEMYVVLLQSKILPFVALIDVLHVAGNSVSDTVTNIGLSSVGYEAYRGSRNDLPSLEGRYFRCAFLPSDHALIY